MLDIFLHDIFMHEFQNHIPIFQKIIRASELPLDWAFEYSNPNKLVVVTVRNSESGAVLSGQQQLGVKINLAAPSDRDKSALMAMDLPTQVNLYQSMILKASAQPGRKVSKSDIKAAALKLPH